MKHARCTFGRRLLTAVLFFWVAGVSSVVAQSTGSDSTPFADEIVKVATVDRTPFSFPLDDMRTGFSIELWEEVSSKLNLKTEYVTYDKFSDMLDAVQLGQADMAIANISVTASREEVMDFSRPIFDSGLSILAPMETSPSLLTALLNKGLWLSVLAAIGLFVLAAIGIAFFERKHEHFQGRQSGDSFGEGFWWSVSVVTNASFTIFTPMTAAGRILAYVLIIIGLFVVSAFVAQITASLTVQELRGRVDGLNDLRGKDVGTTSGSTSSIFLASQTIRHKTYDSVDELLGALEDGRLDAVVHDAPILAYYAANGGDGKFQTVGNVFKPEKYAIALPQNSGLTEVINQEILRTRENGLYEQLINKWFGDAYR